MAQPGQPAFIAAREIKLKGNDLKNVAFHWIDKTPYSLKVVGQFNPNKSYFCPSLSASVYLQGCDVSLGMGMIGLIIGFTDNPAAAAQAASVGSSIVDEVDVRISRFFNWTDYGWYLPVGKTVYVLSSSVGGSIFYDPATGTMKQSAGKYTVIGNVDMNLLETFEQ